jgi:hypothetical protein
MTKRYGSYTDDFELDCEWATLDVTVHWTLDCDDYQDLVTIDKIVVGGKHLRERWNVDYFESLIWDIVEAGDYNE